MNRVVVSIISIILLLSFAMGIYCAGTSKTYDFTEHLRSISEVTEEIPSIEELAYIWTADEIGNSYANLGIPGVIDYQGITMKIWPIGGIFGVKYLTGSDEWFTYRFSHFSAADWGMFDPVKEVVNGTVEFTGRLYYSTYWLANFVRSFFDLAFALSPTSGLVERS